MTIQTFEIVRVSGVAVGVGFNSPAYGGTYSETICTTLYDTGNPEKDAAQSEEWADKICEALNACY